MAKGRIDFPMTVVSGAGTQLDPRFALRVPGGSKSGLALVNVFAISGFTTPLVRLYSATDMTLDPNMTVGGSYWFNLGVTSTITGTGVWPITLSAMSEWVRWAFEAGSTGTIRFGVTVHPLDG